MKREDFDLLRHAMYVVPWVSYEDGEFYDTTGDKKKIWDPKNDDRDSFRLAVWLGIVAEVAKDRNRAIASHPTYGFERSEVKIVTWGYYSEATVLEISAAATRLAILNVATGVGRAKKENDKRCGLAMRKGCP